MPDSGNGGSSPTALSALAQQVRDVLVQFEKLGVRLESQFVRKDIFDLTIEAERKDRTDVEKRVAELEDDKKWLIRLVIGLVVAMVISAAVLVKQNGGG